MGALPAGPWRDAAVCLVLAGACVLAFSRIAAQPSRQRDKIPDSPPSSFTPKRGEALTFEAACAPGEPSDDALTIGFMGDLLVHNAPHAQALEHGWDSLWQEMLPWWRAADLTYGNLEGTFARGARTKTSSKNRLAYDPSLARALVDAGFDVVSTANNHAADYGSDGIAATLTALDAAGLLHTGTRTRGDEPWHVITEANGFSVAWVACTEWNNRPEEGARVLHCHRDRDELVALIRQLAQQGHVVIATPHGGSERRTRPNVITRSLQRALVDAGALLVIGNHPHTVQQWEKVVAPDGREAFVSSCTGASFTRLKRGEKRAGAYLLVALARTREGHVIVRDVFYVPLAWSRDGGSYRMTPAWRASTPVERAVTRKLRDLWGADNGLGPDALASLPALPRVCDARPPQR